MLSVLLNFFTTSIWNKMRVSWLSDAKLKSNMNNQINLTNSTFSFKERILYWKHNIPLRVSVSCLPQHVAESWSESISAQCTFLRFSFLFFANLVQSEREWIPLFRLFEEQIGGNGWARRPGGIDDNSSQTVKTAGNLWQRDDFSRKGFFFRFSFCVLDCTQIFVASEKFVVADVYSTPLCCDYHQIPKLRTFAIANFYQYYLLCSPFLVVENT